MVEITLIKQDVRRGRESKGNQLIQIHLEGWPLNRHMCECALKSMDSTEQLSGSIVKVTDPDPGY